MQLRLMCLDAYSAQSLYATHNNFGSNPCKEKLWWDRMIDKGNTKCRISIWGGIILSNILPLQQVVCYQRLLYATNPITHLRSPVAILHLFINKKNSKFVNEYNTALLVKSTYFLFEDL